MRIDELAARPVRPSHASPIVSLWSHLYCRAWWKEGVSSALVLGAIWIAPFDRAHALDSSLHVAIQGKAELVYDPKRDACTPSDIPDVNARALRAVDGTVSLIGLHFINRALRGPDLDHLKIECNVVLGSKQSQDPAEYDGRRFITALWSKDGAHVAALVHNEYHADQYSGRCTFRDDLSCWYNTILSFRSDDAGRNFAPSRPLFVAGAPFRQDIQQGRHRGFFNPSNIVANGAYKYALISTTGWDKQASGACLFRNTDPLDSAGWRAFDGKEFSVRYEDPYAAKAPAPRPCAPIAPFGFPVGAVVRHRPSGTFVAVWEAPKNDSDRPVAGFYTAVSRDLLNWSAPQLLLGGGTMMGPACAADGSGRDGSLIAYPSILDSKSEGRNFDNVGDEAWLYYAAIKVEGCTPGANRVLLRQKISVGAAVKAGAVGERS